MKYLILKNNLKSKLKSEYLNYSPQTSSYDLISIVSNILEVSFDCFKRDLGRISEHKVKLFCDTITGNDRLDRMKSQSFLHDCSHICEQCGCNSVWELAVVSMRN